MWNELKSTIKYYSLEWIEKYKSKFSIMNLHNDLWMDWICEWKKRIYPIKWKIINKNAKENLVQVTLASPLHQWTNQESLDWSHENWW
jgi:hypothetical protein